MLWFGSGDVLFGNGGVSRFADGTWTTYTARDGLGGNVVLSIAVASDSTLWFGTHGGGVSRFDGANWITYTAKDGLADNVVWSIAQALDGALWFGTSGGLSRHVPPD